MSIRHAFVSAKTDGADDTLVQPSDWNADHEGGLTWFIVTDYGATGDGTTDDTASINDAIADLNTAGEGVLYFPAGTYKVSSTLTTITARCLVKGDGMATWGGATGVSMIDMTINNGRVFTFTGHPVKVQDIGLETSSASAPVSGSVGIRISSSIAQNRYTLENVSVWRFYNNVEINSGAYSQITGCVFNRPINYNLFLDNTVDEDHGDLAISDCAFLSEAVSPAAHLRFEGGGGLKVTNSKFNWADHNDPKAAHAIDMAMSSGSTGIILFSNNSFENASSHFIRIVQSSTGALNQIIINGNQFAAYTGSHTGQAVSLTATAPANLDHIIISNNIFRSDPGSARHAVGLTNVDNVTMVGNELVGQWTSLYSASGSTNISSLSGDHGDLSGLSDDDHTQYLNEARHDALSHETGIGPILVTSTPAGSPLVFTDLLQNSEGTDLLYASEP